MADANTSAWQTPRFLWLNAWRPGNLGHERDIPHGCEIRYHTAAVRPDAHGFYCGLGVLEDKRKLGHNSIWLELRVSDSEDLDAVVTLLIKVAAILKANPGIISAMPGPLPQAIAVDLPDIDAFLA